MKQEDKELLLKDLCARLLYGVKVAIEYSKDKYTHIYDLREIDNDDTSELRQQVTVWNYGFYSSVISYPFINCRPYLRPMSSMTEEEMEELNCLCYRNIDVQDGILCGYVCADEMNDVIDWLNKNMFDYRGLIPKGLAIEVTESNNPYNKK